jgi:pyruvate formate lyase activating enzyme
LLFGGLQKNSFIDYPGRISCVVFLTGCNFKCPYCHNPDLARGKVNPDWQNKEILCFLESRRDFLDAVVISGGEPTLQDGLDCFCREVKELGYPVKLDTNGSSPDILIKLIDEHLVDYIAMDIKTDPERYPLICKSNEGFSNILTSIRVIMDAAPDYEFRTTCVKPLIDHGSIEIISRHIKGAKCYILQQFHNTGCLLNPEFFERRDRLLKEEEIHKLKKVADRYVKQCLVR